ncbi:IS630 transposase-related protein [Candidatus Tisiphia endosymbiont of Beris chalybata]|uniref:IS630 transposase-related protein n=1 Tax=Candidatus Tisiphia endosymbiont of Beris chalybata TaxID=3066262 RepID=UPI00312CA49B
MAAPYPYELRIRVISALESKMPVAKITGIFKVCRETVYKFKNDKLLNKICNFLKN